MKENKTYLKGRGAQINTPNPYADLIYDQEPLNSSDTEHLNKTDYIPVVAKTIVNKVPSSDIPLGFSINPYQGCEHGCVYCYARNTHPYWGYSAGLDFERKILIKKEAPALLEKKLRSKNWVASPIMLSGNTDCYQPIEQELEITRKLLEVFWKYRHPVGIITKNALITRDLDILQDLAKHQLVKTVISVTSLNYELQRKLEPRTASIFKRLKTIRTLAAHNIPVQVMMAPVIPGLNEHEIFPLAKKVAECGASSIYYTLVRLNGDVATIFIDWLEKNYPDRAEKVLNKIKATHGGTLNDSRKGKRMSGEGRIAEIIRAQFKLANRKFFKEKSKIDYNLDLYEKFKNPQMKLF